jgi:uncharacterized protein YjiS (DUF1127 family)
MLHMLETTSWGSDNARQQPYGRLRRLALGCLHIIAAPADRARQRRALAGLDDHLLRDIGISRGDARRESAMPFWR